MASTFFPSDELSWTLLALLLLYGISAGGMSLSLPALGAIAFIGYIIVGSAQQHH